MEKVILVDMEPGCHDFPCSSSGFEPWNAMFQFSRGIPFFLSYSRDITNIALSFPYVPLMFFFLSSVKDNTDYFCNVLRLCFI